MTMPYTENTTDILERVKVAVALIRPFLQSDGGDIEVLEVTPDMTVKVRMLGACGCCQFNMQTLKTGVEQTIRKEVPEIKQVVAID
jgi:Fe-S cluster biogenesis protein NfuA